MDTKATVTDCTQRVCGMGIHHQSAKQMHKRVVVKSTSTFVTRGIQAALVMVGLAYRSEINHARLFLISTIPLILSFLVE